MAKLLITKLLIFAILNFPTVEIAENALDTVDIPEEEPPTTYVDAWDGPILTAANGTVEGPSGKETYYNLPMDGVVAIMRNAGYSEEGYPYWIRDDGCGLPPNS